jgi:hypothetical protein
LNRSLRVFSEYCPHPPRSPEHGFDARVYWLSNHFSIHVRDSQSTLDGMVAYAVLFCLLFLSSFANLPTAGLVEIYRDSLLRTGLVTALALAVIIVYVRFGAKKALRFRFVNAKESLLASFLALLIWALFWTLFGELSGTYRFASEPIRIGLAPLALCVGLLNGLLVYAYCAERFVTGLGRTVGILISSLFGWLLFVAVSVDFALYLFPVVLVLMYVGVRTDSPVGPTVAMGLLMALFYAYFAVSPWILGSRQVGYWFMTIVSVASAFVAQLIIAKLPFGVASHGGKQAI